MLLIDIYEYNEKTLILICIRVLLVSGLIAGIFQNLAVVKTDISRLYLPVQFGEIKRHQGIIGRQRFVKDFIVVEYLSVAGRQDSVKMLWIRINDVVIAVKNFYIVINTIDIFAGSIFYCYQGGENMLLVFVLYSKLLVNYF